MRRIILSIALISILIGVTIISISSIKVPDPLHSTSTVYKGKIAKEDNSKLLLKDVQKEKKMALKQEKEERFLAFLTPEQQTKYKEIIEAKKKEMEKSKS